MDDGLKDNDPYRGMNSGKDDIRPGFLGGKKEEGESANPAINSLKSAEKTAGMVGLGKIGDGVKGAQANEKAAGGLFSGSGKAPKGDNNKAGLKGMLKKGGPIAAIIGIIAGVGGGMMGAQSLMPVAIEEMIIEKFNSIGVSSSISADNMLNTQLNQGVLTHSEKRGECVNGTQMNLFAFSEFQVEQFATQGIRVIDNVSYNGIGVTVLLYRTGGKYKAVVGSDYYGKISDSAIISAAGISAGEYGGQISVSDAFADRNFKTPYTTASKSWRGGSSGWFDTIMDNITETKLSIERNRWSNYVTKGIKTVTEEFRKVASGAARSATTSAAAAVDVDEVEVGEGDDAHMETELTERTPGSNYDIVNEDGTSTGESLQVSDGELSGSSTLGEIESVLNSKALKAASSAANATCAVLNGLMSIYTIASTFQSLQFLNLITGFLESVDKMKAGDGDGSPIHEYGMNLTAKAPTRDNQGEVVEGRGERTSIESAGMSWLFAKNNSIDPEDPSVQNVNFESIMSNLSSITDKVKITSKVYEACGYVKAATAAVDLASTIISFIPIIGQGIKAVQITAKGVAKAVIKAAAIGAFYVIIPIAAKKIANMLIKDAATEWFGEDLGNAIVSGASKYLGGNGSSGGQSPGSRDKVLAYMNAQDTVIAEEADYQRSIRSPFDITSHYTFLGSLAYSLIPLAYSSGGLMSVFKGVSSTVSNSLVAMLPTANAIDNQSALTSDGKCDLLGTVDAQGDAFCNPYIITDTSTINLAVEDVMDVVANMHSGESEVASIEGKVKGLNGNNIDSSTCNINSGSDLAKYTLYCGQRTSQYGIQDAQIASALSGEDTTAVKILSKIPIANNITDIATGLIGEANLKWSNGRACVASDKNSDWEGEYKYYQRYNEVQRQVENLDPGYKSVVSAFLEDHYEQNPLDTSFEGTLARFSGMTKEEVDDTLALIDYYYFLDQYDPSERYAFGEPEVEEKKSIRFDNDNKVANTYFILLNQITFADVRNRSFAV